MEKKIIKSLSLALGIFFLFMSTDVLGQESSILFNSKTYDYGTIKFGKKAEGSFPFENVGGKPVIIHKVLTSCGCVSSNFDKKPIKPGGKNEINITFHAVERVSFNKTVMVFVSDQKKPIVLNVKGKVL